MRDDMTYVAFHALFIVPPILLLAWLNRGRMHRIHDRAAVFLVLMCIIAFVYTTPWDNYLVRRGVWSYGADRVIGVIGYVPLEAWLMLLANVFWAIAYDTAYAMVDRNDDILVVEWLEEGRVTKLTRA